jgi:histidyl-tRNA synthetase
MAKENGPMSGFRDLLADQMIPRQEMLDTVRSVYESYGFVPLKTPALERYETMTGKYGEEGEKLMYDFEDNGGRRVAMRYDQTVPLARVVAQYSGELPNPYKRYALGDVWRGESPQAGRYREFTQFDADTVGSTSYLADSEIIAMMSDAMSALDVATTIRVNDRHLLDGLAEACGLEGEADFRRLITIIDKIDKVGAAAILSEVSNSFGEAAASTVNSYVSVSGTTAEKLKAVGQILTSEIAQQGVANLMNIMGVLAVSGYGEPIVTFDPTVARGLDYYTSTIYETTLNDLPAIGSVCSGGRYDNLIESMGGPSTPAVGTSIGVDRLLTGMGELGRLQEVKTNTKVFVANMDPELEPQTFALTQRLRKLGVPTELYLDSSARMKKQLRAISQLGVRFAVIYGKNEAAEGQVQIKDMDEGTQASVPIADFEFEISKFLT